MKSSGWTRWALIGAVGVVLVVVGGPFVYFKFIQGNAPAPLTISTSSPTSSPAAGGTGAATVDGTWTVARGSQVGYRVKETLFGQSGEAVGRTEDVTGSITIDGTSVTTASFTADMTTVASDESRRDNQFRGRIMDTDTYPNATFKITEPIVLTSIPAQGVTGTATVKGTLSMHGVTRAITFTLSGRRNASTLEVSGSIPIHFADYNIENPSFGPAQTGDDGTLEFLLKFERASA
jgi:polyisoprenoid-binding protein YceI